MNYSYQREAILFDLKGRCDHPTAAQVYETVKQKIPNISLATVYRNLTALCKNGDAASFYLAGTEHFDGNVDSHLHFSCSKCGRIYDVFNSFDIDITEKTAKAFPGAAVNRITVIISGLCESCNKTEKNKN